LAWYLAGWKESGHSFETSLNPKPRTLNPEQVGKKQVIPGLEQGLGGMGAGEERRLFVPAKLAYADRGVCFDDKSKGCLVPPNTDLVYDVTLIQVAPPPI